MFVKQLFVAAVVAVSSLSAHADYPNRPVTLIVPFGPGSGVDTVARIIQPELEQNLGVPVVIKNASGAGGQIGTQAVVNSESDGHTIGMSTVSTMATNFVFKKQPYSLEDFSYVSRIGLMSRALIVNQSFPANSWQQFVTQVRHKPNQYFYTTVANSVDMLDMHLITDHAGLSITPVPYPDNNAAFRTDLVADRVQITYNSLPVLTPFLQNNDARLLAITGDKRNPLWPNVPTLKELGVKELGAASFYGIVGPRAMKAEHVSKLNQALAKTLASPEVADKLFKLGITASSSSSQEHRAEATQSHALYVRLGKKLNIQAQ